jgi:hypothetical protein
MHKLRLWLSPRWNFAETSISIYRGGFALERLAEVAFGHPLPAPFILHNLLSAGLSAALPQRGWGRALLPIIDQSTGLAFEQLNLAPN